MPIGAATKTPNVFDQLISRSADCAAEHPDERAAGGGE
jgi:hypothetical protein